MTAPCTLVLLRHGESTWNRDNIFTGWTDVPLSAVGEEEAVASGRLMADESLSLDVVHTSVLTRAIDTANLALAEMGIGWLPVARHWRLNERHYGALQGLNKKETAERHGAEQVHIWRRSYNTPPPALDRDDDRHPRHDRRYRHLPPELLPDTECLADVVDRMLPYWYDRIVPELVDGKSVLVAAHGNSLRALVKHLDGISDDAIPNLNIPTGIPLVYELDTSMRVMSSRYLGDAEAAEAAATAVAREAG
ncbi:MAG: 2,3-diphosphoglycerate-dependent phosphoglycerate mutase [Acidimicrobiia bacterium]